MEPIKDRALVRSMSIEQGVDICPSMTVEFLFPHGIPADINETLQHKNGVRFVNHDPWGDVAPGPTDYVHFGSFTKVEATAPRFPWLWRPLTDVGRDWRILAAACVLAWLMGQP